MYKIAKYREDSFPQTSISPFIWENEVRITTF